MLPWRSRQKTGRAVTTSDDTSLGDPRREGLPPLPTRRGLSLSEAAAYVGVSPASFDRLVEAGVLPGPVPLGIDLRRKIWDRLALDRAFDQRAGTMAPPEMDWLAAYR